jgi:hypothetical protein
MHADVTEVMTEPRLEEVAGGSIEGSTSPAKNFMNDAGNLLLPRHAVRSPALQPFPLAFLALARRLWRSTTAALALKRCPSSWAHRPGGIF